MGNLIDLRTVIFMATLLGGLMGVVLVLLNRSAMGQVPGLNQWARATGLVCGTALLFGLRDFLPAGLSVTLANALLMAALLMYLHGTHLHFQQSMRWAGWLLLCGVCMVGVAWFAHADPNFRWRTVFALLPLVLIILGNLWLFVRQPGSSLGRRYLAFTLSLMVFVVALRWAHALVVPQQQADLFAPSGIQSLYLASYTLLLMLVTVGFVLLASERMRALLEFQASHDALTGAFNRRAVLDRLAQELVRSNRYHSAFSVLMLDLDHFKHVNDHHGHLVGDEVLKSFVQRLGDMLRPNDLLGRLGGEEFLVLLPETSAVAARATADRILLAVAQPHEGLPLCTTSIGLTTWLPRDRTVDELVGRADRAMYTAKLNGRNRVEVL